MSKELTEKWKNGELDCGWYYIKIYWGAGYDTIFDYNTANGEFADFGKKAVKEVLAPVPSYEDYRELLIKTEQLEKRLEVSKKEHYRTLEQLRIATKALKRIDPPNINFEDYNNRAISLWEIAYKALKEMEGVK